RQLVRDGKAERGGDRRGAVRRAERVVLALGPPGETAEAAALAKRADPVAPPGDDLVRIGLVPDVPDHLVVRSVEHVVDRDRQLDDAKARAKVPARYRDGRDHLLPKLVCKLGKLVLAQFAELGRVLDRIQEWRVRPV